VRKPTNEAPLEKKTRAPYAHSKEAQQASQKIGFADSEAQVET
jgi:hypothetical protein